MKVKEALFNESLLEQSNEPDLLTLLLVEKERLEWEISSAQDDLKEIEAQIKQDMAGREHRWQ